jgi:hypothetical protein
MSANNAASVVSMNLFAIGKRLAIVATYEFTCPLFR